MTWLRGLSIRTRITLATMIVALVVSLGAGLLLHANVTAIIRATTIQLLEDDAAPIEATIRATPTAPKLSAGEGQLVLVVAPSGATALSNLPDALVDKKAELEKLGTTPTVISHGAKQYLVMREFVQTARGSWRIVVARSTQPGNLVLSQLGVTFVAGGAAMFLLFGVTSWVLSGAALRPVRRMRAEAQRLGDATTTAHLPVGPARDELAELATTLNELIDRNRSSVERERQMISDASHELRTPLAVLIAQLDSASVADSSATERAERTEQARQTATRLARLATNLLDLTSIEARRGSQTSTGTTLAREFSECIDRARTLADDRSVLVDFDVQEESPDSLFALAPNDFGRLVDNLLANAVAASEGGAAVQADFSTGGDTLTVTVLDQGAGMPDDFIPIAFNRFTRPEDARARSNGGSGLGLAIVAAIVESSGGTVTLTNRHPGLEVRVVVPRVTSPV